MKIQIASDLHLEFGGRKGESLCTPTEADVIVLAGDIGTGVTGILWAGELSRQRQVPVLYVPGNHEFYGRVHPYALKEMRQAATDHGVHLLDGDGVAIQGTRFLGATLWTDYKVDPHSPQALAMQVCEAMMNDHRRIRIPEGHRYRRFAARDAAALHLRARAWLEQALAEAHAGPTVVVTHHGPSPACQHRDFPIDALAGAFLSDLDPLFDPARVSLWIYGHTHSNLDTQVRGVRLVANQPGYPGERPPGGYDPAKVVEV